MAGLPKQYSWLALEPAPEILRQAIPLLGTLESPGVADNPTILAWAKELNLGGVYSHDSIPWCGLFMALIASRAKYTPPESPMWAKSWAKFGNPVDRPMLGDVLTFTRDGGGHVALYVGEDADAFHILGGNQKDSVCIVRKLKDTLFAARRCPFRIGQPANVRPVFLAPTGGISQNEA